MLNAEAWPYPVFDSVACRVSDAKFGDVPLDVEATTKGYLISGSQLRERSRGTVSLQLEITTTKSEVASATFGELEAPHIECGARVLCQESNFTSRCPSRWGAFTRSNSESDEVRIRTAF